MLRIKQFVALFMLVMVLGTTVFMTPAASAHTLTPFGTNCKTYDITSTGSPLYAARVTGQFCYDGSTAWVTRNDCSYITWLAQINQTWCGIDRNNSSTIEVGSNFLVSVLFRSFPLSYPSYYRVRFNSQGQFTGWDGAR